MDRLIYMDNAATTSVKPEVLNSMLPFFTDNYANPSTGRLRQQQSVLRIRVII